MNPDARHNYRVILITFILAILLDIFPLPDNLVFFKPEWLTLTLIYWIVALPQRVGIFTAWFLGLFVDVIQNTHLGLHGISFAVTAYFCLILYKRIRLFPRVKQALVVAMLIGVYLLIRLWLKTMTQPVDRHFGYWIPMATSALMWPWLYILLRDVRRKYRVN